MNTDFLITGMVYRKWYNPLRYILGKMIKNKCTGTFTWETYLQDK